MKNYYQQGDVLIKRLDDDFKIEGKKLNHCILAKGETTGHKHEVIAGRVELYDLNGILFMKILTDTAIIKHDEHKEIVLQKGQYEIGIVKEFDYFLEESRNVQD